MKVLNMSHIDANDKRLRRLYEWLFVVDQDFDNNGIQRGGITKLIIPSYLKRIFKEKDKILSLTGDSLKRYVLEKYPEAYYR
ncbi:hypothetical protein ACVWU4_001041 [Campylobacter coli]